MSEFTSGAPNRLGAWTRHLAALALFGALSYAFCWPGSRHVFTHYIGPGGEQDMVDSLWNMWHFRHALTVLHSNPLWTDHMYWPYGFNLILAQYTLFADIQAYFLTPLLGLTATYNILLISYLALSGYSLFLLAHDWKCSWGASFIAGAMFAFSPIVYYVVYSGDGYCYQVYFPAVFFIWGLSRAIRDGDLRFAALAAAALTIEWMFSYYYFLFCCLLIPVFFVAWARPASVAIVRRAPAGDLRRWAARALELGAGLAFVWVALSLSRGQREFHGQGSPRELLRHVAPYGAFWASLGLRLALSYAPRVRWDLSRITGKAVAPFAATMGFWAALNLPLILATLWFMKTRDYGSSSSPWRGGGNPTDPLMLLLPDSLHPLWGGALSRLYDSIGLVRAEDNGLGLVPLAAVAWLWRRRDEDRWVRLWFVGFATSFLITLGPWLKLWGVHTYLPMPFYFLHLLPVFSNVQHGMRFNAFATLFMALLVAVAVDRLRERVSPRLSRWVAPLAFCLIALEYFPPPRMMSQRADSPLFDRLAARPDGAMLTLPTGAIFNGISAAGSIGTTWHNLVWQTIHHKPIVGGYLGRVPRRTYETMLRDPYWMAMVAAGQGRQPQRWITTPKLISRYLRQMHLRYVLVNEDLISPQLRAAARRWPLERIDSDGPLTLYRIRS